MGDRQARFSSDLAVSSVEKAREKVYSDFGSRHHVKRREITIDTVEEVEEKAAGPKGGGP